MEDAPHILHVFPNFGVGGAEMAIVSVVNALGRKFQHSFMAAHGDYSALARIDPGIKAQRADAPPRRNMWRFPLAMRRSARKLSPDLICTYNWGATDMLVGTGLGSFCGLVHNEHGFGADEAQELKRRRVWAKRLLLRLAYATVVPSETLLKIAREEYLLPGSKIRYISNSINTDRFIPGQNLALRRQYGIVYGDVVFGFVGALRPEKNLSVLIESFRNITGDGYWLMIVGDGPCLD